MTTNTTDAPSIVIDKMNMIDLPSLTALRERVPSEIYESDVVGFLSVLHENAEPIRDENGDFDHLEIEIPVEHYPHPDDLRDLGRMEESDRRVEVAKFLFHIATLIEFRGTQWSKSMYDCPLNDCEKRYETREKLFEHIISYHPTHRILEHLLDETVPERDVDDEHADETDEDDDLMYSDPALMPVSRPENAPFAGMYGEDKIMLTLPASEDSEFDVVRGVLTPAQARSITLGLRSCAAELDGEPFFAGGWSDAEFLRYAANSLERMSGKTSGDESDDE